MRMLFKMSIKASPVAAPPSRSRQVAGYARMAPTHNAKASAPLHASVTSIGSAGAPSVAAPTRPCHCVSGNNAFVSTQLSLRRPNTPMLYRIAATTNLRAGEWESDWSVSVGTADLLDRQIPCREERAQLINRFKAAESRRARKNVEVDGAVLRPGVDDGVRLLENQHACQTGAR